MKHLVDELAQAIHNQCRSGEGCLIRLDYLPNPEAYLRVCRRIEKLRSGSFVAKLSKEKYEEFCNGYRGDPSLAEMVTRDWVDMEGRMTYYRNMSATSHDLVLLMGTEAVEDRGGLADFHVVSPKTVEASLKGKYSKWVRDILDSPNDSHITDIDSFLETLFRHVPVDLVKLSSVFEEIERGSRLSSRQLVKTLAERLYRDWGLPRVVEYKTIKQLLGLVERSAAFRDRLEYRDGVSSMKLERISEKFDRYAETERSRGTWSRVMERISGQFANFDDFKEVVIDYLCGSNIDKLRPKVFSCDFALIYEILGIQQRRGGAGDVFHVGGSPLEAFLSLLLQIKAHHDRNGQRLSSVEIKLHDAAVADCTTNDELQSAWTRICVACGGVLDFIIAGFSTDFVSVAWAGNTDPFLPSAADLSTGLRNIRRAAAGNRLTTIDFKVRAQLSDGTTKTHDVQWKFLSENPWTSAFLAVTDGPLNPTRLSEQGITNVLPFCVSPKVAELVEISTEDEFVSALSDLDVRVVDLLPFVRGRLPDSHEIQQHAGAVATCFRRFTTDLVQNGFFNTMAGAGSSGFELNRSYRDLLKRLCKTSWNSQVRQRLNLLANAFLMSPSEDEGVQKLGLSAAIVPAYHPAMLEKIQDQAQFVRDGAVELIEAEGNAITRVGDRLAHLFELSTIASGLDVVPGEQHGQCHSARNTFAYHSLYHTIGDREIILSTVTDKSLDVVVDDYRVLSDMKRESSLSRLITNQLKDYLTVFPWREDELTLVFINPSDLQPIVAAMSAFVEELRKEHRNGQMAMTRVNLHILVESLARGGRGYLRFWLDGLLDEDDPIELRTYCTAFDAGRLDSQAYLEGLLPLADIAFVHDFLDRQAIDFQPSEKVSRRISEKRFPMVYPPLPVSETSTDRQLVISQPQFEIAHLHTQLIHKILRPNDVDADYRAVVKTSLGNRWKCLISKLHERSQWVVAIDSGIDRELIYNDFSHVISFSTGDGPFGELNHVVSCSDHVLGAIRKRLRARLQQLFTEWSAEALDRAVEYCLSKVDQLDGLRLIRALSLDDYQVHSFLAYILATEELGAFRNESSEYAIRTVLCLDNYRHWFPPKSLIPDFLLLEAKIPSGGNSGATRQLNIRATLIECKMGNASSQKVEQAIDQLIDGRRHLGSVWNPNRESIDRRYWFSQLYRALAFSPISIPDNDPEYGRFVAALDRVVDGAFDIEWNCALHTYWLDQTFGRVEKAISCGSSMPIIHRSSGLEYIGQMLQPPVFRKDIAELVTRDVPQHRSEPTEAGNEIVTPDSDPRTREILYPRFAPAPKAADANSPVMVAAGGSREHRASAEEPGDLHRAKSIGDVRVFVGHVVETGEPVYWEYGNRELPNRHLLICGSSGTGKTYLMQCLMLELAKQGISSVVFDYTDGFTRTKLEPEFSDFLGNSIIEFPVYSQPFPLNPFKRHEVLVAGQLQPQKTVDVADRIKSVFQAVYRFGDQQASAIYQATRNGLEKHGDRMTLGDLRDELHAISSEIPNAKTVLSKIEPMVDREPFSRSAEYDWGGIRDSKGKVFIVQLSGLTREVQLVITEMVLWDAWYYNLKHGDQNSPFPVILDEAQNLDHRQGSPSTMILTEGRKFGWSGWFATQFLKRQLSIDEIQRLQQASMKIYFSPPEAEVGTIASMIDQDKAVQEDWRIKLSRLRKGECVVSGFALDRDQRLRRRAPRIVRVASLKERIAAKGEPQ